jgi:hypothetical protein
VATAVTRDELEAAHCWEADDQVPRRPATTEFRRRARYHQARWREAHGHPIGTQPIVPQAGKPVRPVGSRLPLDYGRETGASFLTAGALEAARRRTSFIEPHQSFDHQRLWADLLSSEALAFNVFGELASDLELADRAVHAWWPDVPGTVADVRFAHSPGRFDPEYLHSLRAFDVVVALDVGDDQHAVVAVDVEYHERNKGEIPKPRNMPRNGEVAERSGAFRPGVVDEFHGRNDLTVKWLEHLLLLSMLQHPSGEWTWGRYVVVHPADNPDATDACARYRDLLADESTFATITLDDLLAADALPSPTTAAVGARYLVG